MSFSFAFAGDDIEDDGTQQQDSNVQAGGAAGADARGAQQQPQQQQPAPGTSDAFPVQGKPQLPPERHDLGRMLAQLPSRIAYGTLEVPGVARLPRRELWDVRVQLAAEDEGLEADEAGLGQHDVRTGIYEGGFKSWESSVDLVKVLSRDDMSPTLALAKGPVRMIELGCGTALPSLAVFQRAGAQPGETARFPLSLTLADYNPSVLQLVTLPNFVLAWALQRQGESALLREALSSEDSGDGGGELEMSEEVKAAFVSFLESSKISLSFVSGGWSPAFVELLYGEGPRAHPQQPTPGPDSSTLVVGAETIYSPFALGAFADTLLAVLRRERAERSGGGATSIVAAKRLYFGVGGSLDDFVERISGEGADVRWLGEETEGVRRGVVQCSLP